MFILNLLKKQKPKMNFMQAHTKAHTKARSKPRFVDGGEHATMNDLPIPQGSWKADYDQKQRRYTMVLVSGLASLLGSIFYIATAGKMEFNYRVPDYPYEEEEG